MTENLLHSQHYLNLIAKRYLIQLIDNPMIQSKDLNDDDGVIMEEIETKVKVIFYFLVKGVIQENYRVIFKLLINKCNIPIVD